jgi:hypothetical protein
LSDFSWKVRFGDNNLKSPVDDDLVQEFPILEVFTHLNYKHGLAYYDSAVLIIPSAEFTSHVRPICLPNPEDYRLDRYYGDTSTLIGWGNSVRTGQPSEQLKRTILTIYEYR